MSAKHLRSMAFCGLRKLELNAGRPPGKISRFLDGHELHQINLIIGPNGGGKSTVVDIVRCLGNANMLPSLLRENIRQDTESGFQLFFDDGTECRLAFNKADIDVAGVAALILPGETYSGYLHLNKNEPAPDELHRLLESLGVSVQYRNRHDESGVPSDIWLEQLNKQAAHLIGIGDYPLEPDQPAYEAPPGWRRPKLAPLVMRDSDTLSIQFNDDAPQHNHVKTATLPSGWRAFGGLLAWLSTCPEGSICVIEEPETHLHPTLQRVLIREMALIADQRRLQIFATTHSPAMIDYAVPQPKMGLFEVNGWRCHALSEPAAAILAVGARPSDLCLANGLVWVEGPSDRVYLLHWLSLWCMAHEHAIPVENVDFAFAYYGGSLLAHYSVAQADSVVAMFGINPNAFLLMDRDLDFSIGPDGGNVPINANSTKARIREDMISYGSRYRVPWITDGYTIESYLPDAFREDHFRLEDDRLVPRGSGRKVAIANTFAQTHKSFDTSHGDNNLPDLVEALYQTIRHWQRY